MRQIFINGEEAFECYKYPNYFIARSGNLYSIYIKGAQGKTDINNPHKVCIRVTMDGYYDALLSYKCSKKYVRVHRIVAEQFIGPIPDGMVVNHLDGNKLNNSVDNLEITTISGNVRHAHRMGFTKQDIPVVVRFPDGHKERYFCKDDCLKHLPIGMTYLNSMINNDIRSTNMMFLKSEKGGIDVYWNGNLLDHFNSMTECDKFYGFCRGYTSSSISTNRPDKYCCIGNQYHFSFPSLSTIKNKRFIIIPLESPTSE